MTYTEELIQKREKLAFQQGKEEGIKLGKLSVASRLLEEGFSKEKTAALLDLKPADILRYIEEKELPD